MKKVSDYLKTGKENSISAMHLCEITGIKSKRALQMAIAKERRAGTLILASNQGYFLPMNRNEIEEYVKRAEKQAVHTLAGLKCARQYLRGIEGQECLL